MRTLRQLAESSRLTPKVSNYQIPAVTIEDAPAMEFRGFHLCWFPETTAVMIERYIRLAAYYKMNYIVIEIWAMYDPGKKPTLSWPHANVTRKGIKRLVKIADELGVTLIPQFNAFGHASGSRVISHKHSTLDINPEYQSLFEPLGWTWCLSNPETLRVIDERIVDLHEAFGNPPYFHIGFDESYDQGSCSVCRRRDYPMVVRDHVNRMRDMMAERNCRIMMWHDMLLQSGDPRWKGFYAYGNDQAERLLESLPRDVIICDWYYGAPKEDDAWPTLHYFKSKGFDVLACPWENRDGYHSVSKAVREGEMYGMLSTTWHHLYGESMMYIYLRAAQCMWGTTVAGGYERLVFAHHLRQIGWDVPVRDYEDTGVFHLQLPEKMISPR